MATVVSLIAEGQLEESHGCIVREGSPSIPTSVLQYCAAGVVGQPLIVTFTAASEPASKRRGSVFEGRFLTASGPVDATIVGVNDPSVSRFPELRAGWYQGHAGHAVADELTELIAALVDRIRPSRLVFVGRGGGGHPALVQSWRFPESACAIANPQTSISRYYSGHVQHYRRTCWPELAEQAPLSSVIVDEVSQLYRRGHENFVVYLQHSLNDFRVRRYMLPFLRSLPTFDRLVIQATYCEGVATQQVPAAEWRRWILALLAAQSLEQHEVVAAHSRMSEAPVSEPQPSGNAAQTVGAEAVPTHRRDLEIATALAARVHSLAPRTGVEPPSTGV
ncbi:MAG: hypothetical protein JW940_06660 [Polyangiaceae bacterium]|nr:hypothetical protein [Polyangiaceae bacterium]